VQVIRPLSLTLSLPLVFAIVASIGCGEPGPTPDAGPETAELGTGPVEFETLGDDQEITLLAGLQGGYHFVVHARMSNMIPGDPARPGQLGNPLTTFFIFKEDGTQIDIEAPPYRLGYTLESGDTYRLPSGRLLQIDQNLVEQGLLSEIYDTRLRLRVEIRDVQGRRAFDEVWVIAKEEIDDRPDAGR